jgi:hypothetical protein
MLEQFLFVWSPWLLPITLLVVMGLTVELTYRFEVIAPRLSISTDSWSATQSGIATLAAFVLSLSFAQASARFDSRRALVIKEANSIGTTWLRADQLHPPAAHSFRRVLTDYTATRLAAYSSPNNPPLYAKALERSASEQAELWALTSSALRNHPGDFGLSLLMQSLNDTIDVSAEQLDALTHHVPVGTIELTILLAWLSMFSLGVRFARNKSRPPIMSALTVLAMVAVLTMIVDYDRPQTGIARVSLNALAIQLHSMQQAP